MIQAFSLEIKLIEDAYLNKNYVGHEDQVKKVLQDKNSYANS